MSDRTIDDHVREWLSHRAGIKPATVASFAFKADPRREWSEYTIEDFSCRVSITLTDGEERSLWLSEDNVVDMLNSFMSSDAVAKHHL